MTYTALITFATAMFTILNPIGNTAIFAGMVSKRSKADRRAIAVRCALAVAVILVVTVWNCFKRSVAASGRTLALVRPRRSESGGPDSALF